MDIQKPQLREVHWSPAIFGNSANLTWAIRVRGAFTISKNHVIIRLSQQANPWQCLSGEGGHVLGFLSTTCIKIWDHWNMHISCFSASEIQMMTLPPGQFVITDSGVATPVTTGQVKAVTPVSCVLARVFLSTLLYPTPLPLPSATQPAISELEVPLLCSHDNLWSCILTLAQFTLIIGLLSIFSQ